MQNTVNSIKFYEAVLGTAGHFLRESFDRAHQKFILFHAMNLLKSRSDFCFAMQNTVNSIKFYEAVLGTAGHFRVKVSVELVKISPISRYEFTAEKENIEKYQKN